MRGPIIGATLARCTHCCSTLRQTPRWLSSWPKLESATGRARKRRRQIALREGAASNAENQSTNRRDTATGGFEDAPAYPKGRPWRVLWPHPHGNPDGVVDDVSTVRRWPHWKDVQAGWRNYVETWEDGLRGEPTEEQLRRRAAMQASTKTTEQELEKLPSNHPSQTDQIQETLSKNIDGVKETGQDLLEQAKERTGIYNQDDLRSMATDMMKLATQCLQEFMAGYRQGRDEEVDKMLHEYFQEENQEQQGTEIQPNNADTAKAKRRKAKRAMLRE